MRVLFRKGDEMTHQFKLGDPVWFKPPFVTEGKGFKGSVIGHFTDPDRVLVTIKGEDADRVAASIGLALPCPSYTASVYRRYVTPRNPPTLEEMIRALHALGATRSSVSRINLNVGGCYITTRTGDLGFKSPDPIEQINLAYAELIGDE